MMDMAVAEQWGFFGWRGVKVKAKMPRTVMAQRKSFGVLAGGTSAWWNEKATALAYGMFVALEGDYPGYEEGWLKPNRDLALTS